MDVVSECDSSDWQSVCSHVSQLNISDVTDSTSVYMDAGCTCAAGAHSGEGQVRTFDGRHRRQMSECVSCSRRSLLSSYSIDVEQVRSSRTHLRVPSDVDVTQSGGRRRSLVRQDTIELEPSDDDVIAPQDRNHSLPASPKFTHVRRPATTQPKDFLRRRNTDIDLQRGLVAKQTPALRKMASTVATSPPPATPATRPPSTAVQRLKIAERTSRAMTSTPALTSHRRNGSDALLTSHRRNASDALLTNGEHDQTDDVTKPEEIVRPGGRLKKRATYHSGAATAQVMSAPTSPIKGQSQPVLGMRADTPASSDVTPQSSPATKKRSLFLRRGSKFLRDLTGRKQASTSPTRTRSSRRSDASSRDNLSTPASSVSEGDSKRGSSFDDVSAILRAIRQHEQVSVVRASLWVSLSFVFFLVISAGPVCLRVIFIGR